jgi:hypothetical protein
MLILFGNKRKEIMYEKDQHIHSGIIYLILLHSDRTVQTTPPLTSLSQSTTCTCYLRHSSEPHYRQQFLTSDILYSSMIYHLMEFLQ